MTTDWREKHVLTKGQKTGRNWSAYYSGALETIFTRFLCEMVSNKICVVEFREGSRAP